MDFLKFGKTAQFSLFKTVEDSRFFQEKMADESSELAELIEKFIPASRRHNPLSLCHTVLEALYEYTTGWCFEGHSMLAVGKSLGNDICVIYKRETYDKLQYVKIPYTLSNAIMVKAAESDGTFVPYNAEKHRGRAILLALVAFAMEKYPDFRAEYEKLKDVIAHIKDETYFDSYSEEECLRLAQKLVILTSSIYYKERYTEPDGINLQMPLIELKESEINSTSVSVICGDMIGFPSGIAKSEEAVDIEAEIETTSKKRGRKKKEKTVSENLQGMFSIVSRKLSKLEEDMIPKMASWYVCPNWVKNTCEDIKDSEIFSQKIRNVLLAGPAGTGKTKGVQAMASALGLPYVKITCSPDTEIFDFIGQMLPATTSDDETDFKYVKTDLIRAIENGWVCEIQEPTVIKRSSVLVGLNAILENDEETAFITLPTGEVIRRHPDCVIVMTTNSSYDGCKAIQQSVLSRMDLVREVAAPTDAVLLERAKAQTGFENGDLLQKMVNTITRINEFSEKNDITDGICGPRELYNWAKKSLLNAKREEHDVDESDVIKAAFTTVLSKMAQNIEDREALINGVFSTIFLNTLVDKYNKAYLVGNL